MRHVLNLFNYTNKDPEVVGVPDPLIVGPAADLFEDDERPDRMFPTL
jgi:hypothetical protein